MAGPDFLIVAAGLVAMLGSVLIIYVIDASLERKRRIRSEARVSELTGALDVYRGTARVERKIEHIKRRAVDEMIRTAIEDEWNRRGPRS